MAQRLAVITGASSGIGAATAEALGALGWRVVLVARREDRLREVAERVSRFGGEAVVEPLDAGQAAAVAAMADRVRSCYGVPGVLVNAAGAGEWRWLEDTPPADMERMLDAPFRAAYHLTHAFMADLLAQRAGVVVHVGRRRRCCRGRHRWPTTCSRWALRGLHESLSQDLVGTGVHTCHVLFGEVSSEYFDVNPGSHEHIPTVAAPIGLSTPGECAEVIVRTIHRPRREVFPPADPSGLRGVQPAAAGRRAGARAGDRTAPRLSRPPTGGCDLAGCAPGEGRSRRGRCGAGTAAVGPTGRRVGHDPLGRFAARLARTRGIEVDDYDALWRWSVDDLDGFWAEVAADHEVIFHDPPTAVLGQRTMPGAEWFPGATLNYAEHALRRRDDAPAVIARSQTRPDVTLSFAELAEQVGRATAGLRRLGVARGDRVVAYAPNVPETLVAFLACASIGAVWSSCAPEFGVRSVVDRVRQIEPRVLLVVDGYRYGGKAVDRAAEVADIRAALPTLEATVVLPYLSDRVDATRFPDVVAWDELVRHPSPVTFTPVPFDHPLYVLYSSGTTGLPKAIVHGHGGILLEHLKVLSLSTRTSAPGTASPGSRPPGG